MTNQKLSLQDMWNEINARVQKIEFEKLWKGFKKYPFAVYNDEAACLNGELIPKTDEFIANTGVKTYHLY